MSLPYDPDLADRMANMDPALLYLLTREIATFARWDVLRFYLETDEPAATMDAIAAAVGRDAAALVPTMGELVSLGWLARRTSPDGEVEYLLTQDRDRQQQLERLHASLHDRQFYLQALYHWTRGSYAE
jgi:DNA-binding MarR family transcriptional regulator